MRFRITGNRRTPILFLSTFLLVLLVTGCGDQGDDTPNGPNNGPLTWNGNVWPALSSSCQSCHSGAVTQNGFDLTDTDQLLNGTSTNGNPYVIVGNPDSSELVWRLEGTNSMVRMPFNAGQLSSEKIQMVRDWIDEGAELNE